MHMYFIAVLQKEIYVLFCLIHVEAPGAIARSDLIPWSKS